MGDLLKMDYINSLPQPFMARLYGGDDWPVNDGEIEMNPDCRVCLAFMDVERLMES